jgi:hypothetical protein
MMVEQEVNRGQNYGDREFLNKKREGDGYNWQQIL